MSTAADYPILSVKRSPTGDCLAIRNAERNEQAAWVLFSEEGDLTESVEHDYVADWLDMVTVRSATSAVDIRTPRRSSIHVPASQAPHFSD